MTVRHLLSGATLAAASMLFVAGAANAQTPLLPGTNVTPVPTVGAPTGAQVASRISTFDVTNTLGERISGSLLSAVYQNGATLDFFYQLTSNSASTTNLGAFSVASFANANLLVGQTSTDIDGGGPFQVGESFIDIIRREPGDGAGLTFLLTPVTPGNQSFTALVRTDATQFTFNGAAAVLGAGGISANLNTNVIAPTAPGVAPEPGSLALAATGLMGAMGMVIRRRRSAK